jgi:hypothetical protein
MALGGDHEVKVVRHLTGLKGSDSYQATRSELREALGSLEDLEALTLLREYFRDAEKTLVEETS